MVSRTPDALELLLPDAPDALWQRAHKLTTFLRLLSLDAKAPNAEIVDVNLERAKGEFERDTREQLRSLLRALLVAHAAAAVPSWSFLWFGDDLAATQVHWSAIEEFRDEHPWLATVPAPDESARSVAERLLESCRRAGWSASELELWSARLAALDGRLIEARERLARARAAGTVAVECRAAWLVAEVELALDAGAARAARALLEESVECVRADARARRLAVWVRLLLGDPALARNAQSGLVAWSSWIPQALIELRESRPDWLPWLAGRTRDCPPKSLRPIARRADVGASARVVIALGAAGAIAPLEVDLAPGLRSRFDEWLRSRDGAALVAGAPEHRVLLSARRAVLHRSDAEPVRAAIDPATALALVVEPILDGTGEVAGWLWLEFEHHLLPSHAELDAAARACREELAQRRRAPNSELNLDPRERSDRACEPVELTSGFAVVEAFAALVDGLSLKLNQRHWWGWCVVRGQLELAAQGGAELDGAVRELHEARALSRALRSRGVVIFDDPDARLSIDVNAASGVVIPLIVRGEVRGLLAVESTRRRDFRAPDVERWVARANAAAHSLVAARFADRYASEFGSEPWFGEGERVRTLVEQVAAAGRCRSPISIHGERGAGKRVLARWVHEESAAADGPCVVFHGAARDERTIEALLAGRAQGGERSALERALGGSLIALHPQTWPASIQERLAELIQRGGDVRWIATFDAPLAELERAGRVVASLAHAFGRFEFAARALRERREDLPRLIECLARRFATGESLAAPRFEDDALALLWRQNWPGNLRELENFIYKLVVLEPREVIDAARVEALARELRIELVRRIASRHPDPAILRAALETTRHRRGGINKSRAAAYLGWDPDTLVSRLSDLQLAHSNPANEVAAPVPATELDANSASAPSVEPIAPIGGAESGA